jgi:(p)ppGpp synthase/HD superfamily hydrolase
MFMDFSTYRKLEKRAWALIAEKAGSEMRSASAIPNQPYWTHLIEVHMAQVINGVTDPEELLATILHDIVEDSDITTTYLAKKFSQRIADIVGLVSKSEPFIPEAFYTAIMSADADTGLPAMRIKVNDRINNLITNMAHNLPEKAEKYAAEARQYFIPMADKVGLRQQLEHVIRYVESTAEL